MRLKFLALAAVLPLAAQTDRIAGPIDGSRAVTLSGHVNPNARPEFDQGPVDDGFPLNAMALALKPSAAQQADLDALLAAQQDPASPDYHRWLTPADFADRFGASSADIAQISGWLESQGFSVHGVAPSRNWISFGGTAAQARQAFGVEIHRYAVNGESHFANSGEPSAPAAFAGMVAAIRGLDDFLPRSPLPLRPLYTAASGKHYLAPDDAQTIYDLKPLYNSGYDGTGQKIAIAGQSALETADVQAFRTLFGLPANTPQVVPVPGIPAPAVVKGDVVEADLDVEWAGAMAKNATLIYVYSQNVFDAVQYAVAQNLAPVVSLSYGTCETGAQATAASLRLIAEQANAQGITWIAASGDSGAFGCESGAAATAVQGPAVLLPASIPEVTGVGGTEFNEGTGTYWAATNNAAQGSALSYIPETTWNDTTAAAQLEASGGGPSAIYAKPSWQAGTGVPSDGARDVPDLAMPAGVYHDPAIVCTGGSCANGLASATELVGGTSLAAQVFAGIAALVNDYEVGTGAAAKPGLANLNPTLYAMAAKYADAFHDVVSGNNVAPCKEGTTGCASGIFGYDAGVGYDLVTGLGSVDANTLAVSWKLIPAAAAALSAVSVSPATVSGGASVTITVDLTGPAPSGGATVTLSSSSSALPAPASVVVAAGLSTVSVSVKAAQVTAATSVTLKATYNSVSKSAGLSIEPVVLPNLTAASITPSSVVGGASAVLAITLSAAAPSGGASVALASNSAAFPVPASVTVPAKSSSVQLSVKTATVTASTPVTVTATYNGASKTAAATVTPAVLPTLTAVTVTPTSVVGGFSVTLAVTLSGPAPSGGATVTIASSNSTVFPAPATIVVPAGRATAVSSASGGSVSVPTTKVTASTSVTVTATYNGASKTAALTVTPVVLPTVSALAVTPASLTGGNTAELAVTLSGPAPPGGASVTLASSNAAFAVPASVAVAAGASSASLSVHTAAVSASTPVTVTATYNGSSKTAAVTLTPVVLPTLSSVTVTPASVAGGESAVLAIALSGPAPKGGASVSLSSNNAAFPVPASVTISSGASDGALIVATKSVTASTAVTITATYNGGSKTGSVTLTPVVLPTLASVTVTPASLTGGSSAVLAIAIALSGPAPKGGASVSLSSSSAALTVPASTLISGGSPEGALFVQERTAAVTVSTAVTITATYNGVSKTATVTLTPAATK